LRAQSALGRTDVIGVGQWAEIRRLQFVRGLSIRAISRRTGLRRDTIRRAISSDELAYSRAAKGPKLDPVWVALLADAQRQGRLDQELDRLQRIPLLIFDEVGCIPFDPHAANLMFMLVSRRCERASLIVTSNKPFSAWDEIFGDQVTAAAMIDRLVHHAEILAVKGDSYRHKDRDLHRPAPPEN
jgi:hypothetical protein